MSKRKTEINKGNIQNNVLKALVKSNLFRHKAFKNKKGRGSYSRKGRNNNPSGFPFPGKPDFFTSAKIAAGTSFIFFNNF
ncbi:alternative ribosome rescue factor ArfA [Neisseria sp.]|uniref:alternative ribosome rescue factor ArfA n=1 Tax=Neisseria sp. TaxID=192066 RepID=UPI0026DB0409|nr:alternative ribosome rescue factor ArfA [Neisseria sp.]MDO4906739.1 alternative ribosome rescue factor ArfA [Neisseria sp.]